MLRSRLLPLCAAVSVLAVVPTSASAVTKYSASIKGTFTSEGSMSERCGLPPDFTQKAVLAGSAKETVSFRTTRPALIYAQRRASDFPAVVLNDSRKPILATAKVRRDSTLGENGPRGCSVHDAPADCGERTLALKIGMGAHVDGRKGGVVPDFGLTWIDDRDDKPLFDACWLMGGQTGFGGFSGGAGFAPVSERRLMGSRRLVLHGTHKGAERGGVAGPDAVSSFTLRYTITLTRKG